MSQPRILVVDDEPISLDVLEVLLSGEGYAIDSADCGEAAWKMISTAAAPYDVILLDRMMPDIDGIEVLRRIKSEPRLANIPVVMQTAMTAPAEITEGLRAGAFYYLTKPFSPDTLIAIVDAAVRDHREWLDLRDEVTRAAHTLAFLEEARFNFRTPLDAHSIATLVANVAPDPGRLVVGISELMLNAVEHGNLAITYDEKSGLIASDQLQTEITRRLALPEYAARVATLQFRREGNELQFVIRDQGAGFDWAKYLDMTPDRAFDTHGRGIAMSRMLSFDHLEYRGCGNEVLCVIRC